jgi:hypothetical protein
MRWWWVAILWFVLVRVWFHGPVRLGRWMLLPDWGWLTALLALGVVGSVLWAYRRWPSVLEVWKRRSVRAGLLTGTLLFGWVVLTVHVHRVRVPRGFAATYYERARLEGIPFLQGVQADTAVRTEWVPTPGQPFAVLWTGYFRVERPERYEVHVEAVDGAVAWLTPAREAEARPFGWGRAFGRFFDLRPGWYALRIALLSETGGQYALIWSLCGSRCRSADDFFPAVPPEAALRSERRWRWVWWAVTGVGIGGLMVLAVRRRTVLRDRLGPVVRRWGGVVLPLGVGMVVRALMHDFVPAMFSSDEAVYHSMMVDILEGRGYNSWKAPRETNYMFPGHPTFEYGQAYGGTLVAHVGALLTPLVGRSWKTLLYAIDLLVLIHMLGVFWLARTLWDDRVARWTLWLLAIPHYQEVLMEHIIVRADIMALTPWLLGLIARLWMDSPEVRARRRYDLWIGFLTGLLLWIHPSSVSVLATVGLLMVAFGWVFRRQGAGWNLIYSLLGFLMGVSPVLLWNMRHDWIIFRVPTVVAHTPGLDWEAWVHFWATLPDRLNRVLFFLVRDVWGALWVDSQPFCRPMLLSCQVTLYQTWIPPEPAYVKTALIGIPVLAALAYLGFLLRTRPPSVSADPRWVPRTIPLILTVVTLWMNAMAAPVLIDARYMTHLFAVFPPLVAWVACHVLDRWRSGAGVIGLILVLALQAHVLAYGRLANQERTRIARGLVDFLRYHHVRSVITNFETAYWLMWMTDEAIVAAPGYNPPKDRHSLLTIRAFQNPRSAVLLPVREAEAMRLEPWLSQQGIRYRRYRYRDWLLLKDFSTPYWHQTVRFI